LKTFINFLCL